MRRFVTSLLLMFGLFAVCSCSKKPQIAKLPPDGVVLAFCESITFQKAA